MKWETLVAALKDKQIIAPAKTEITGISSDSRRVGPGQLFVAITGDTVDGHQFINAALNKGAAAVIMAKTVEIPPGVGAVMVPDTRFALSALADKFYDHPSGRLKLVGITGTNGKTTISYLVKAIGQAACKKSGVIGTAGVMLENEVLEEKGDYTTPEAHELQRFLAAMAERRADLAAMEVSSHALVQHRVAHCRFQVAVFSNLTHEHLDYHGDMDKYFQAKAQLFRMLQPGSTAVVNVDDSYGPAILEQIPKGVRVLTYGLSEQAAVRAEDVELSSSGTAYTLNTPVGRVKVAAPYLFGTFNISNALAAVAAGMALGITPSVAAGALSGFKGAPGRYQPVDCGQDFTVVVDYAHTPDGFEKLLQDVANIKKLGSKIIIVFGSAGHRDRTKRPSMGKIAGDYCDVLVLTEEDPRSEDAAEISRQIASGVRRTNVEIRMIEDRTQAINYAVSIAAPDDIVLVTGKGNETRLEVRHPTSWRGDVPAVVEALQDLAKSRKDTIA